MRFKKKKQKIDISRMSIAEAREHWTELDTLQHLEIANRVADALERFSNGLQELMGGGT